MTTEVAINKVIHGKPGRLEAYMTPPIVKFLETPLSPEVGNLHPTEEEVMQIKMIQTHVDSDLNAVQHQCQARYGVLTFLLILAGISLLIAALCVVDKATMGRVSYTLANAVLVYCLFSFSKRYQKLDKKIRSVRNFCSSLVSWSSLIYKSKVRLEARGILMPHSLGALIPFLTENADQRVLSNNGERDTIAMIRLAEMLNVLARSEGTSSIVFSGETEELLGRVADTLGAFPSRVKPGEVML